MPTPVKLPAVVEEIIRHTERVKSFIMRPLKHCPNFKPGQFLHLAIDVYDPSFHWPESRVFSIANSPTRRDRIRVTFSVKGKFTQKMFNDVCEGDTVWIKLPYGNLLFPDEGIEVVLIAGGTGITPFVSYLEYIIDNQVDNNIVLYYGVRSPQYLVFDHLLHECKMELKNFNSHIFIEKNASIIISNNINKGILSIQTILEDETKRPNAVYYLSGPRQMILSFRKELIGIGIRREKIIIDEWE